MNIDPAIAYVLCFLKFIRSEHFPASSVLSRGRPVLVKASAGGFASQGGGNAGEETSFPVASGEQRGARETSMAVW